MANFIQDVGSVQASKAGVVSPGDSSDAARIQGAGKGIAAIMDLLSAAGARGRQIGQQKTLANAIESLEDLNFQAKKQAELIQQGASKFAQTKFEAEADGTITEEERQQLAEIEKEVNRLDNLAKDGVINPDMYRTKRKLLYKKFAADPSAAGIQTKLATLFFGPNAVIQQPKEAGIPDSVKQVMDAKYPQGWGAKELADEQYKAQKAAAILSMPEVSGANVATTLSSIATETWFASIDKSSPLGELFTPTEQQSLAATVMRQGQDMKSKIIQRANELKKLGKFDAETQKKIAEAMRAVDETVQYWTKDFFETKAAKMADPLNAIQYAQKVHESLVQANMPLAALKPLTGGEGGGVGGLAVGDMATWNEAQWNNVASFYGEDAANKAKATVKSIIEGYANAKTLKEMAEDPTFIQSLPPGAAALLSAKVFKQPITDKATPDDVNSMVGALEMVKQKVGEDPLTMATSLATSVGNIKLDKIDDPAAKDLLKSEAKKTIVTTTDQLLESLSDSGVGVKLEDGQVKVDVPPLVDSQGNLIDNPVSGEAKKSAQALQKLLTNALSKGIVTEDDLSSMLGSNQVDNTNRKFVEPTDDLHKSHLQFKARLFENQGIREDGTYKLGGNRFTVKDGKVVAVDGFLIASPEQPKEQPKQSSVLSEDEMMKKIEEAVADGVVTEEERKALMALVGTKFPLNKMKELFKRVGLE